MQQVSIKEVLSESIVLYKKSLPALFRLVIPLLAVIQLIELTTEFLPKSLSAILAICSMLASAYANALSVKTVYSVSYESTLSKMQPIAFLWYILANSYLLLAFSLTASLVIFAIPGLLILVVTALSPIFILEHSEGPIQAIVSSCEHIRGNIFKIAVIMISYCVVIFTIFGVLNYLASLTGVMAKPIGYIVSVFFCVLWLYHSAVIMVLYRKLHPNNSLKDAP